MNIIIVGAGTVGSEICAQLVKEGHDITVVDKDITAINEITTAWDVYGVLGNGADVSVLRKAGADKADLLIAVSTSDELNILCCAAAKKLGTKNTSARVRNPEYSQLISLMKEEMSVSLTINPELAVAREIHRMLKFPSAAKIDTFCKGRVELAQFVISDDSILQGKSLNELRSSLNIRFVVCSVLRDGEVYIPDGNFVIKANDTVCVTISEEEIAKFFKTANMYKQPIKDILIVGGGRTTYYLQYLLQRNKINSTVIEKDKELCRALAEQFTCTVVCDNGTKQELLLAEGIEKADAFLALSGIDEENAIMSMFAKNMNVKKVITMISRMSYVNLFNGVGLESIVSPKSSIVTHIMRYVRSLVNTGDSEMESLHKLMEGRVEAIEFNIKDEIDGITQIPLKELRSKNGILIACMLHNEKVIIPSGNDVISPGDTVIVVATEGQINNIEDILS